MITHTCTTQKIEYVEISRVATASENP